MESKDKTRFKILIIDDVPKNIQVAASILQESGYKMAFAQDGPTAMGLRLKPTIACSTILEWNFYHN